METRSTKFYPKQIHSQRKNDLPDGELEPSDTDSMLQDTLTSLVPAKCSEKPYQIDVHPDKMGAQRVTPMDDYEAVRKSNSDPTPLSNLHRFGFIYSEVWIA